MSRTIPQKVAIKLANLTGALQKDFVRRKPPHPLHTWGKEASNREAAKRPFRTDVINFLLGNYSRPTTYLEIGVRNPADNFTHIKAHRKVSVDPGIEFKDNPVDFPLTSDKFFSRLDSGAILPEINLFDVIFVDGLHLAEQVDRDINNALRYLAEDGFLVLHDCNPPTEWHARERFDYHGSPAIDAWNGTTWKAFQTRRFDAQLFTCCIDTDWGVGVISKSCNIGNNIAPVNPFFEYAELERNRTAHLNLVSFDHFKKLVKGS